MRNVPIIILVVLFLNIIGISVFDASVRAFYVSLAYYDRFMVLYFGLSVIALFMWIGVVIGGRKDI